MKKSFFSNFKEANLRISFLLILMYSLLGCNSNSNQRIKESDKITYLHPVDSISFTYQSSSWKGNSSNYTENQYGQNMFIDSNNNFKYVSINSRNEIHVFDFGTNQHSYSEPITSSNLEAWLIDSNLIYLLYNDTLHIKDYDLNTIDAFAYKKPKIKLPHGIDFSVENNNSLFKVNDYYVLMYYVVDKNEWYRNTKYLFYYFNQDTSFFSNKVCEELETSFQYFRYPVIASDGFFLYHAPRVLNCISKSNELKTQNHSIIDNLKNNYLSLKHIDQYQISKLKKYRFSTDYNKEVFITTDYVYLLKEFPIDIHVENNIQIYNHNLELIKFDKNLKKISSYYIKDNVYYYAFMKEKKMYLFNFKKNKYYVYEI
ncbi:MAG: hypothetical protein M9916_05640 [Crocinitomicaceae bacterium]|jgi:hypothetical protein|nr:hypothetical protein [Crocinitomicaceae bacterium]